jgi:hypothetical protein
VSASPREEADFVASVRTDADGRYRLERLPPDTYVIAGGGTFHPATTRREDGVGIRVTPRSVQEGIDIRQARGFTVRGRLALAPALTHSPPVTVSLWYGTSVKMETVVRPDLSFEFRNVPPERSIILSSSVGLRTSLSVSNGAVTGIELGKNVAGIRVSGKVVAPANTSLSMEGLWVVAQGESTRINADGTFEFLRIAPRAAVLEVRERPGGGFAPYSTSVAGAALGNVVLSTTGQSDIADVNIPVSAAQITGRVLLGDGAAVPGAWLTGRGRLSVTVGGIRPTLIGDTFTLTLREGSYRVAVDNLREGYRVRSILHGDVDVTREPLRVALGNTPRDLQIVLERSGWTYGTISGTIRNADGSPAVAVFVGAVLEDSGAPAPTRPGISPQSLRIKAQTDANGRYRLENVPPGNYYIAAGKAYMFSGDGAGPLMIPTYFPGTPDRASAAAMPVGSGSAIVGADVRFPPPTEQGASFKVAGRILGQVDTRRNDGLPGQGIQVTLARKRTGPGCTYETREVALASAVTVDGSFQIVGATRGEYCLWAWSQPPRQVFPEPVTVAVIDRDLVNVDIVLRPPPPRGNTRGNN